MKRALLALLLSSAPFLSAEDPAARDAGFRAEIEALYPKLVETRRHLHQHPELSDMEAKTADYIAARLRELGFDEVKENIGGHGIVALLKGAQDGPCVAVRADMDALPIPEISDKPYRSQNEGVMHACGHDIHMTVALGVAELLSSRRDALKGSVKFLFQPAEEGMPTTFKKDWGAKRMVREGAMENPKPDVVFALHSTPLSTRASGPVMGEELPFPTGMIGYCIGPSSANSDRFRITIHGTMAHGAAPQNGVDAVVVASQAVLALQNIRSRQTPTNEPLVLTVGTFNAGTRENIIAETAVLTGTVRTYNDLFRDEVIELMHRTLKGVTESAGATYEMDYRKGYPAVINPEALALQCIESLQRVNGAEQVVDVRPSMGGEDFSFFSQLAPGFYFRLGVANVEKNIIAGVHTPEFDVDESCLKTGVASMAALVCDALDGTIKP